VLEEGEVDFLGVFGGNGDPVRVPASSDPEARRAAGEKRIGLTSQAAVDNIIVKAGSELRLGPHGVEQLIVAEINLANVEPVV
jgi:hypothetical protein